MAMVVDSAVHVTAMNAPTGMAHMVAPSPSQQTWLVLPRCSGLRLSATSKLCSRSGPAVSYSRPPSASRTIVCEQQQETMVRAGEVTDKTWKELVLDSDIPVMVDFWAPWCGPCRMIAPLFDELAVTYAGRVRCFKLNTDECPTIATDYGIRSIPTVMIFKNGQKKDTIIGAVPKAALISAVEKFLDR